MVLIDYANILTWLSKCRDLCSPSSCERVDEWLCRAAAPANTNRPSTLFYWCVWQCEPHFRDKLHTVCSFILRTRRGKLLQQNADISDVVKFFCILLGYELIWLQKMFCWNCYIAMYLKHVHILYLNMYSWTKIRFTLHMCFGSYVSW